MLIQHFGSHSGLQDSKSLLLWCRNSLTDFQETGTNRLSKYHLSFRPGSRRMSHGSKTGSSTSRREVWRAFSRRPAHHAWHRILGQGFTICSIAHPILSSARLCWLVLSQQQNIYLMGLCYQTLSSRRCLSRQDEAQGPRTRSRRYVEI
jgi:hypothetical protein